MPKRIQRQRTKGWRKPEGAIYVGRPSRYGNVYWLRESPARTDARQWVVDSYRQWLGYNPRLIEQIRSELTGKDLMCWCPLDQPCHADVLLEIANGGA